MTPGLVLVTGAGGFVCSEIAVALARAGHDVLAVDRAFDATTLARLDRIARLEGPLEAVLASGIPAPVAVIHGAAITASPERLGLTRAAHIRHNVDMLTATLDFAGSSGAARFVFLSSMGVFAATDRDPVPGPRLTETALPTGGCPYAAAKRAGEAITAAAAEPGFATLSLRLGNIAGPHEAVRESRQDLCLAARMIAEARAGGAITVATPAALREWAWLPDLATGVVRLLDEMPAPPGRVLHAGTPPVLSDLALARAIAERLSGTTVRLAPAPHLPVRPPMGAGHRSVIDATDWTPMDRALDRLLPEMAGAVAAGPAPSARETSAPAPSAPAPSAPETSAPETSAPEAAAR